MNIYVKNWPELIQSFWHCSKQGVYIMKYIYQRKYILSSFPSFKRSIYLNRWHYYVSAAVFNMNMYPGQPVFLLKNNFNVDTMDRMEVNEIVAVSALWWPKVSNSTKNLLLKTFLWWNIAIVFFVNAHKKYLIFIEFKFIYTSLLMIFIGWF